MAFTAEKHRGRQFPVPISVRLFSFGRRSNHPDVTFFQLLYQSNEIRHPRDRNILKCARGHLGHHTRQPDRPSLGDENTMNASTFRSTQDRSHVAWVFKPIQSEHEGWISSSDPCFKLVQQHFGVCITGGGNTRHYSLVSYVTKCP